MKTFKLNSKMIQHPLIYDGVTYPDYGINVKTGDIYSKKRGNEWRLRSYSRNNGVQGTYPQTVIRGIDGNKTIRVHKACCETIIPKPKNWPGVTVKVWKRTPVEVKVVLYRTLEVNHIDHNTQNYKPNNLEWATSEQNKQKSVLYYYGT